jgi:hypothetical protein
MSEPTPAQLNAFRAYREQGVDEQTRMSRAGHRSVKMARHYARTVTSEDVAAAAALQEAIGG